MDIDKWLETPQEYGPAAMLEALTIAKQMVLDACMGSDWGDRIESVLNRGIEAGK